MKELGPDPHVEVVTKLARDRWRGTSEADKRKFQQEHNKSMLEYKKAVKKAMGGSVPRAAEENEEEGGEMKDKEEEKEQMEDSKKRKATSKNDAPGAKKGKTAGSADPAEVEAEARKLGFLVKLKTLKGNLNVRSSAEEILAELKKRNGSVVAA